MMKLFDTRIAVHETPEGDPAIDTHIEKLDEMLTQYKIDHSFTLPTDEEIAADPRPLTYQLYYLSEQNTEMTLVVCLWAKLYLNKDKNQILEAITKSFSR